jgi:hypothetical protein
MEAYILHKGYVIFESLQCNIPVADKAYERQLGVHNRKENSKGKMERIFHYCYIPKGTRNVTTKT